MSGPTHELTPDDVKIYNLPPEPVLPDREQALILASALAWAVGKLEGMEVATGYAGQVLEWWQSPRVFVPGPKEDA